MLERQTDSRSGTGAPTLPAFVPVLVLGLLPWVLLAVSTDWIYSDAGLIDAWLYHGYFHRLPEFLSTFFSGTYYGTRLAWIVPGYVLYHVLPPHMANITLHVGFFYASLFALHRAASILAGPSAALLSAVTYGTWSAVLVALGWDYVDGAVITYSAVAIWAVVESAARPNHRVSLLLIAGGAGACVVHSNLGGLLLTPAFLIAYWCTHSNRRWRDAGVAVGGVVLTTALLGIASVIAGGPFLFFLPSVKWQIANIGTQPFIPVPPLKWPGSVRFILPLAGLGAAAGALSIRRTPATRAVLLMLLWLTAVFAAHDWLLSAALLQTQYYVSWFLPLACLGIAVALGAFTPPAIVTVLLCLAVIGLQAAALIGFPGYQRLAALAHMRSNMPLLEVLTAGAALLVIVAASASMRRTWQVIILAGALVLADFIVVPNLTFKPSSLGESQFIAVQQTLTFIDQHVPPTSQSPRFWIGRGRYAPFLTSVASTHLYLYSLIGDRYPRLPDDTAKVGRSGAIVQPANYVVVAADSAADEATVRREFQRFNMDAVIEATTEVRVPRADFVLTLLRITDTK